MDAYGTCNCVPAYTGAVCDVVVSNKPSDEGSGTGGGDSAALGERVTEGLGERVEEGLGERGVCSGNGVVVEGRCVCRVGWAGNACERGAAVVR